jgi:hypothetical protein
VTATVERVLVEVRLPVSGWLGVDDLDDVTEAPRVALAVILEQRTLVV